jgi:hypothetical protein
MKHFTAETLSASLEINPTSEEINPSIPRIHP